MSTAGSELSEAQQILQRWYCSRAEGLALFDALEPAGVDFMRGSWAGSGLASDHSMDGLLELYGWHGKRFESAEDVHPLVFQTRHGQRITLGPRRLFAGLALNRFPRIARAAGMRMLFRAFMTLFRCRKSRARVRITEYRGKATATMIYDNLPINDVFAKIDDDTVLGVMDLKGMQQPFFFVLRREA